MKSRIITTRTILSSLLLTSLPARVLAANVLTTSGYTTCQQNSTIQVTRLDISFDKDTATVTFNAAGTNDVEQNVTAHIDVSAYGKSLYSRDFNPCDSDTYVSMLCPVPAGNFSASGTEVIPSEYLADIPQIAFTVPNLDAAAKLTLTSLTTSENVACIDAAVTNDKTTSTSAVSYAAVGIGAGALALSGVSALSAVAGVGHAGGASTSSPSFTEVVGWFQSMAMNGMLSVSYPSIYRSFTANFGFSTGIVGWSAMQTRIDSFRAKTGGNLTTDSVAYLHGSTLQWETAGSGNSSKRSVYFLARDIITTVNGTTSSTGTGTVPIDNAKVVNVVHGIQGYAEELQVPRANTFMTVLLVFSIILAAITVGILLLKVILEAWALFGNFPKRLVSFRRNYWWILAKTITGLILILYGSWVLYCVYQFTIGDSWAARVLAGVTLALFTAVLVGFTWRIAHLAHKYEKLEGDSSALYDNKETWQKYSIFYAGYKKNFWWLFVPSIVYAFSKSCIIAAADGHGFIQSVGQLVVEAVFLLPLLFTRPFTMKSGNWINIIIQIVRVISVVCVLVFVDELGISDEGKTVTGLVLVIVQSVITVLLAVLIAVNAITSCVRVNPHRKRRKEAEKLRQSMGDLTDLTARNTMLMGPLSKTGTAPPAYTAPLGGADVPLANKLRKDPFNTFSTLVSSAAGHARGRSMNVKDGNVYDQAHQYDEEPRAPAYSRGESRDRLTSAGAGMGREEEDGDVGLRGWKTRGGESGYADSEHGDLEARRPLRGAAEDGEEDEDTSYRGRGPWI